MDGRRTALIVASDEFEHAGLSRLQAPSADAEALAEVLGNPDIGGFEVRVVHNSPSHTVQAQVEDLFAEGQPDDLLLLHFSGHGLKSDSGELFFAATNTRPDRLASTAVSADFVQRCMRGSRARSIVLFLDCCYGGAFSEGVAVRAAGPANVLDSFPAGKLGGGRGRAVITASSAMEYAFEGSALAKDEQRQPSVFTSAVVEGLSSGAADRDEDGLVSLNELYDYVFDQVRAQNPNQTPSRDIELQGELYLAKSRRKRVRAVPLPPDLRAALQDENMYTRLGAVGELRARLASADPGVALGAREALQDVARSDTSYVADAALAALGAVTAPEVVAPEPNVVAAEPLVVSEPEQDAKSEVVSSPFALVAQPPAVAPGAPTGPATRQPAAPAGTAEPADVSALGPVPVPRHRVGASWTALSGGALLVAAALLPDYVDSVNLFDHEDFLGLALLVLGAVTVARSAVTLLRSPMKVGTRWPWWFVAIGVAGLAPLGFVVHEWANLDWSNVNVGIWSALGGGLTTVAAAVVALIGRFSPEYPAGPASTAPRPALLTIVGRTAVGAATTMLLATFVVRFAYGSQALDESRLVWAWVFPGVVGLVAGILVLLWRRSTELGTGLLIGGAAAALWGLWGFPGIWREQGIGNLGAGYFFELLGLVALLAAAVGAVVVIRRAPETAAARPGVRILLLVAVIGVLGCIPFLRLMQWDGSSGRHEHAVHDAVMALLSVAVPVLAARLRGSDLGRYVLLGWAFGATGIVVAHWRLLQKDSDPLQGVPNVLLAMAALAGVGLIRSLWRPQGTPVPSPAEGDPAPGIERS